MAIPARSDFYVIPQFPEVYHGQEVSEALFSAAARRVTGQGRDTTSSVIVSQEHRYILCCRAAARRRPESRSGTWGFRIQGEEKKNYCIIVIKIFVLLLKVDYCLSGRGGYLLLP